jgi:predicted aconitase
MSIRLWLCVDDAASFAMDVLAQFAQAVGAAGFLDITRAHIDGCLYHGQVSLDFVERFVELGGKVRVPTTLNVGAMDLIHPEVVLTPSPVRDAAKRLMLAHIELGCEPTFTCAPYQTRFRPRFGEQIAWGESNAIVFANSVIGARTNRYGDFIDLCCAITGRAPAWGLHLDEGRRGQVLFQLQGFPDSLQATDVLYTAVGYIIGEGAGFRIPVIDGLPPPLSEDQLKALGAVAASTGSVAMFHAVGITPEAPTRQDAFGHRQPEEVFVITPTDVAQAFRRLSTVPDDAPISCVSLGTPHFSLDEFRSLVPLLVDFRRSPAVAIYVNTDRGTYAALGESGLLEEIRTAGMTVVTDTCTYITSIIQKQTGAVMTNSGKWAHYAPANLGVDVAFGSLRDCLASAEKGRVVRTNP